MIGRAGRLHVIALAAMLVLAPALPAICDAWCTGVVPVAAGSSHSAHHHHGTTDPQTASAAGAARHHHDTAAAPAASVPGSHITSLPSSECDQRVVQVGPPPFGQKLSPELKVSHGSSNLAAAAIWHASLAGAATLLHADSALAPAARSPLPLRI